jgi:antitoxin component YwqK of YwqJK toxin-antitoxin module
MELSLSSRMKFHVSLFVLFVFSAVQLAAQEMEYVKFEFDNGLVSSEGYMLDGKPEGYWKTYYDDETLKSEGNRLNHQLDSIWKFYAPTGIILQSISYKNAKKTGFRKTYFEDGVIQKEEEFVNDVLVGTIRKFYPSGKLLQAVPLDTLGKGKEQGFGYEFAEDDGRITVVIEYRNGYIANRDRINRKDKFNQKQGLWREFYPNRLTKVEGRFSNDKKNGYFKTYDEEGNLVETLKYVEGILIPNPEELANLDIKREYHPNAQVKSVGSYSKGVKEGVHRIYTLEGDVSASKIYSNGKVIGDGIVDAEGRRQGPWKEFYETGELRSEGKYKDGGREGDWVFYYRDGKEEQRGAYHKGKPDGDWKWIYDNGQIWREEIFYDGLEEGLAIEYNDTGKVVSKGDYLSGEKEGKWFQDLGDDREEGTYVVGLRSGLWKHYYPSGKLKFEGKFEQGAENGKHLYYFESGQIKEIGNYKFGLKEGDWFLYNQEGIQLNVITYKQGVTIKVDGEKVLQVEKEDE